ncbi:hypothetical protein HUJ05_009407 [Dendroctonus ponderosae]|nr:hypothetical protein HUJ05_009407 [Dendroctonus ponderosae]
MDPTEDMCKSLVKWLQRLAPNRTKTVSEICDGVGILEALLQIEPNYFGQLQPKIKKDVGANWRLRVSNLKKISEAVIEYYQDLLSMQIADKGKPDVGKIGESSDAVQLGKLLRLVLGCAINCERKQEYITLIMEMEESVQQNIMQTIQQLEEVAMGPGKTGLSMLILDSDARVAKLVSDLEAANEAKEALILQNQQMEQQLSIMQEERKNLEQQIESLQQKEIKGPDPRRQMELLKEEKFKAEVMRDDFNAKLLEQEKQLLAYQERIAELQIAASDSTRLKDEVDALTESASKVDDLEQTVASYKRKLEDYQDLKKQVQKLEAKNIEYLQKTMEMEEELTKNSSWRNQCEAYRNQIVELQQKLDEEAQRADKAQFSQENLESKAVALQAERNRLLLERDSLREENEELKLGHVKASEAGAAVAQELTPADLKARLRFLERENKTLRLAQQELDTKQLALDQALGRSEKLQQQNRTLNQTVLRLEAQLEELRGPDSTANPAITVKKLQEALAAKEHELQTAQAKYQRNLEKAREVAAQLESAESDRVRGGTMGATEERMLTAAFYKLLGGLHREAADERLAVFGAQGQSFLARQRQPTPRKLPARPNLNVEPVALFEGDSLGIFTNPSELQPSSQLSTWQQLHNRELQLAVTHPPSNYFQEMILWTNQGKFWQFPINNEFGLDEESKVYFSEHIFLEKYLEPWCPARGPLRHFMELVCVGLSKNSYLTVEAKREHIEWYKNYFEEKRQLLQEVGAFPAPPKDQPAIDQQ